MILPNSITVTSQKRNRERETEREREHISSLADSEGNSAAIAANPVFPVFQWDLPTPPPSQ